ncbi:hypothetical protein Glove_195g8 [Diversispora epigaea]|uniref:ZSWIM1/3 RNaseH-like domain-containing protein n=1 Tax=Diversispora epigaea TaxID=1348612 RepID=A0A397IQQ0_9GLOM|nr:hypothetical protein Glove_195g8 [Diversispora epigaea]
MNIDSPEAEELTSNQKRDLLFNVNQSLELSLQKFDNEWWPLVSNIWMGFNFKKKNGDTTTTYTCHLTKCKQSSERKEGVPSNKRRKTKIRPPNLCFAKIKVTRFFQEGKVKIERFPDSPNHMHSLEESDKVKQPQIIRNLVVQEAIKNYRPPAILNAVKEYASEKMDLGTSVKELRLKEVTNIKYKVCGALDAHLIDSTHKTNRYDYRLFTLYIRNGYGCWDVGAHFFVSNEDSDTISEALKIVRRFVRNWKPRYFLQDQSNIEEKSIKLAFPGLINGEQECEVIFCTVHLQRTWMHKIYEVDTRKKMTQAMYKWTRIGVTSTNALESFHSELKRTTSPQHGIIGACHKITTLDQKKREDSDFVSFEFRIKKISVMGVDEEILQEIHKFPFPVQKMLTEEACAVEK